MEVLIIRTNSFSGAIGKAFHRLYMPMTAYKDELSALSK
jgi:hypothetical protein